MSKKVAFIDRDGTILVEPPVTKQINSLDEMEFLPGAISGLHGLVDSGYELVIVSNQDGLGTDENPTSNYDRINEKMLSILRGEGVVFSYFFTCPHYPKDNCECRKPGIGLLKEYLATNELDLNSSIVIGDRETDIEFARNIGINGYQLTSRYGWKKIIDEVVNKPRKASLKRKTSETDIELDLNLDGDGIFDIATGLKFFDHMLEQLAKHSSIDISLKCLGDLEIDEHHTIEDVAITLGNGIKEALGDKLGIERFAWERILVMDEAVAEVSIDLSGRPIFNFEPCDLREYVGDFPTEMLEHFFQSLCVAAGINCFIRLQGNNSHHIIESCFKAFARCLKDAVKITSSKSSSTKGIL